MDVQQRPILSLSTHVVSARKAEQKFYSRMGRLKSHEKEKGHILGVTGCIAQLEKRHHPREVPFIDFALGPSSIHKISKAVEDATKGTPFFDFTENGCVTRFS